MRAAIPRSNLAFHQRDIIAEARISATDDAQKNHWLVVCSLRWRWWIIDQHWLRIIRDDDSSPAIFLDDSSSFVVWPANHKSKLRISSANNSIAFKRRNEFLGVDPHCSHARVSKNLVRQLTDQSSARK